MTRALGEGKATLPRPGQGYTLLDQLMAQHYSNFVRMVKGEGHRHGRANNMLLLWHSTLSQSATTGRQV